MRYFLIVIGSMFLFRAGAQTYDFPQGHEDIVQTVLELDSAYWTAYNACDTATMASFFHDYVEFLHAPHGGAYGKEALTQSMREILCGNSGVRDRREAVAGSIKAYAMDYSSGIVTGEHVYYVTEPGKPEYRDRYGKFLYLWEFQDGTWTMRLMINYDIRRAEDEK